MATPYKDLTDNQKLIAKTMDQVSELVVAYAGPEVPPIGNRTETAFLEEFGRLNEARKQVEKVEKIVRSRLEAMLQGKKELRGDNYTYKKSVVPRYALNQGKAKAKLEEYGVLEDCMDTSETERVEVKRN